MQSIPKAPLVMLFALILASQFTVLAQNQGDEAKAQELLTKLGARTRWQATPAGKQLEMIDFKGAKVRDEQLQVLGVFKGLRELFLPDSDVTDAGLVNLLAFRELAMLNLSGTGITDAGLKTIGDLPKLRWLALHKTPITDEGLKNLAIASELDTLWLSWTKVSENGLKEMARFPKLRTLRLGGLPVTDAGLKDLAPLKRLQTLWLDATRITDAGLKELLIFKSLEELRLDGTKITQEGLRQLGASKSLKRVNFNGANVIEATADPANVPKERVLRGHTGPVHAVRFTPDGRQLVSASGWPGNDNSVRIWDIASGQQLHRIPAPNQVGSLILNADGTHALAGALGAILYIEVATGKVQKVFKGVNSSCASLELSPDEKHFYSASLDGFARRWSLSEGKEVARYRVAGKWARYAGELPGQRLVTADEAGTLQIWDLATGNEIKRIPTAPAWLSSAAILPGGGQVLTGVQSVALWDLDSGEKIRTFQGHKGDLNALALAPDGKTLLTACNDGTARLWDIRDGSQLNVVLSQEEFLFAAAYSADGRFMAIAGGGAKNGNDFVGGSAHDIHIIETGQLPIQVATPQSLPVAPPVSSNSSWLKIGGVILLLMTLAGLFLFGIWRRRLASAQTEKAPASLAFACSQCGHNLRVKPEVAGKKIKCPKCGTISRAPVNC